MQFPARDLTNQYVSLSYQDVVQRYNIDTASYILDGQGYALFYIPTSSIGFRVITSDQTASHAFNSVTASHATQAVLAVLAQVADFADVAGTASISVSASYAPGSPSISASYALSASYAPGSPSISASYANTSSTAIMSQTASSVNCPSLTTYPNEIQFQNISAIDPDAEWHWQTGDGGFFLGTSGNISFDASQIVVAADTNITLQSFSPNVGNLVLKDFGGVTLVSQTSPGVPTSITASYFLGTASYTQFAKTASYLAGQPAIKSGFIPSSSFQGIIALSASIVFTTAFLSGYSISITADDVRIFTIESKSLAGFTITSNSNVALSGSVYWQAITYGEYN